MRKSGSKAFRAGILLTALFVLWTALLHTVDVRTAGETGTEIGLAAINIWFHELSGVNMVLYSLTDWLGLVPLFVCLIFAVVGLRQLVSRKSLLKVDRDILLLGVYYVLVIFFYLIFEMYPINYRPVLIDGRMEASYPSSTTLLVLSVMPTLIFEAKARLQSAVAYRAVVYSAMLFSVFMVVGRLVSGVHWLTDIVGAMLLSGGLFCLYVAAVNYRR